MSPEERQMLSGLFDRIRATAANPRDRDAEAFISDAVRAVPFAPYILAQTVLVQEQALGAANQRLQELEAQVRDLQSRGASQDAGSGGFLGGIGKSLFGGAPAAPPRPAPVPSGPWGQPAPQYQQPSQYQPAPAYAPAPQQFAPQPARGGGGGFLAGALGAAAGVAGGMLMADSIKGLFGGHNNPLGNTAGPDLGGVFGGSGGASTADYQNMLADSDATQDALQDQMDSGASTEYAADTSGSDFGSGMDSTDV